MMPRTCVSSNGRFVYGVHKPAYSVDNLRSEDHIRELGTDRAGQPMTNQANFPPEEITEAGAEHIFEIANPFPFRGVTYILKRWADAKAADPL